MRILKQTCPAILILFFIVLLAWAATTYNIGPGQTYETFTALEAAVVLAGDDVVDGGDNTFLEDKWAPATSGTDGHPITLQNATIDGNGVLDRALYPYLSNYIICKNMTLKNATGNELYAGKAVTLENITGISSVATKTFELVAIASGDTYITGCSAYGASISGLQIRNSTGGNFEIDDFTGTNENIGYGIYLKDNTFTSASLTSSLLQNNGTGLLIKDTAGVIVDSIRSVDNNGYGVSIGGTSTGVEITDSIVSNNGNDGIDFQSAASGGLVARNICDYNGQVDSTAHGDGITFHDDNTAMTVLYNKMTENGNAGIAFIGTSSGVIYNNTLINNGDQDSVYMGVRAEMYLTATGVLTVKNNVIMNLESYPLIWASSVIGHVFDYNAYISDSATPFYQSNTTSNISFADWVAAVGNETHSIFIHKDGSDYKVYYGSDPTTLAATLNYCPVTTSGKLVNRSDNPLIDAGVRITGVNDGIQTDLAGNKMYGLPDIGCYEVVPRSGGGRIILGAGFGLQ